MDSNLKPEVHFEIDSDLSQKFLHLIDKDGKEYLFSLPVGKAEFHNDLFLLAIEKYGEDKNLQPLGGGRIKLFNNNFYIWGHSKVFGDFDKERTVRLIKESYPESDVFLQEF